MIMMNICVTFLKLVIETVLPFLECERMLSTDQFQDDGCFGIDIYPVIIPWVLMYDNLVQRDSTFIYEKMRLITDINRSNTID